MFDIVYWLVVLSTITAVAFAWGAFLSQTLHKRTKLDEEHEKFEERILELMGQFRHMSAVRLQMLDRKVEELRKLIKQANSLYSQLCVRETELMNSFGNVDQERVENPVETKQPHKEPEPVKEVRRVENSQEDSDLSIERKILLMYQEGKDEHQIAKELNMGVGEVNLVLSLFRFRSDSHQ
ncbi:MAG: hypothetical protein H5T93_00255 [Pseudothermotoga sp.]|uniref:DUF6115 domain-containing protein n=1 Tax=Pseudothermotoga sp. TaxID=2033661 RepID=UPI0019AE93EF|nr:hypothetical protein [Pseudothermotoga sp.]